jgi:hypothetical protein
MVGICFGGWLHCSDNGHFRVISSVPLLKIIFCAFRLNLKSGVVSMSNSENNVCYEYFDCKELDCLRRKNLSINCWDIDDVRCKSHSPGFEKLKIQLGSKLEACKLCIYYQNHN